MDFWSTVRMLQKRWYVVVPALLLSVALTLFTYSSIPTRYSSTGSMLLTTPSTGGRFTESGPLDEVVRVNPLLAFDGSLVIAAQIVAQVLNDPATKRELGLGDGSQDSYLANNGETNSPFVFITAESDTAEGALSLVARTLERASTELNDRQAALEAPASTFIETEVLVAPTEPEAQIGGKIRFAGAALVLSLVLSLTVTFGTDSVLETLRRRRERPAGAGRSAEPRDEPDGEAAEVGHRRPPARPAPQRGPGELAGPTTTPAPVPARPAEDGGSAGGRRDGTPPHPPADDRWPSGSRP
ncbi:hypothetical protein [Umezawaea beigongshangensis]|uniref:hypothetical protein n=1 Tax=Umezawaea beigongshangensis TaxID=2780383 RepID=UPI0018F2139A|nr:hypothetical protein [Umezawaea beigongshangensis]